MGNHEVEGKRVLLADDEESVRESLGMLLRLDSHEVVSVGDAEEALDRFRQWPFDLIITDYAMPGMTGSELAVQIKRTAPQQRILMITAYPNIMPGPHNPVDAVLTKPFSINDLRSTVASLLN